MSWKKQFWIPSYLTLLAQCSVTLAANFDTCPATLETEPIVCNDTFFFCPNGAKPEGNKTLLTRLGCETFCGQGYDLYSLDDIIIRFMLWLLPVLILAAHFHFPALGKANTIAVGWGLLGNPIGSLYAMLTRVEQGRSSYWRAKAKIKPQEKMDCSNRVRPSALHTREADAAADVAAICLACDEFGWHDPLDELVRHLPPPSSSHSSQERVTQQGKMHETIELAQQETNEEQLVVWKKLLYLAECRHESDFPPG